MLLVNQAPFATFVSTEYFIAFGYILFPFFCFQNHFGYFFFDRIFICGYCLIIRKAVVIKVCQYFCHGRRKRTNVSNKIKPSTEQCLSVLYAIWFGFTGGLNVNQYHLKKKLDKNSSLLLILKMARLDLYPARDFDFSLMKHFWSSLHALFSDKNIGAEGYILKLNDGEKWKRAIQIVEELFKVFLLYSNVKISVPKMWKKERNLRVQLYQNKFFFIFFLLLTTFQQIRFVCL